ncbi:hypothetical protein D3C76_847060 [compost metagenome]
MHQRRWLGPWLPRSPGVDRRTICGRSVGRAGRTPVSHRRPGTLDGEWRDRIPRPSRSTGQVARVPGRAGGNPGTAAGPGRRCASRGAGARHRGRGAVDRLLHRCGQCRGRGRANRAPEKRIGRRTAGIHGAGATDAPGQNAPRPERQARPPRVAGTAVAGSRARRACDRTGTTHRRHLARSAGFDASRFAR